MTRHVRDALDGQWRIEDQGDTLVKFCQMRWRPPAPIAHALALRLDELAHLKRKAADAAEERAKKAVRP